MIKKRKQVHPISLNRPKRTAHANTARQNQQPRPNPYVQHNNAHNNDMRILLDKPELGLWFESVNSVSRDIVKYGMVQYFIGQKCEQFSGDVFKSGDIDLSNFFWTDDLDRNKIHKCYPDIKIPDENGIVVTEEEKIGRGIILKSLEPEFYSSKKVFILFEDLYKIEYTSKNILLNIDYFYEQFKRITHYPNDGICIKILDPNLRKKCFDSGIETIINFKK